MIKKVIRYLIMKKGRISKFQYSLVIFIMLVSFFYLFFRQDTATNTRFSSKPNILLITVCSLRQDHLSCYGYQRNTSPNIDNLAKEAILYKNCHTPIPWTKPATIALMTGKYPSLVVTTKKELSLAGLLHSTGYLTCGVVGTNVARESAEADVDFDIFWDNRNLRWSKDQHTVQADTIVNQAIKILDKFQVEKQPVFLWLFFKDPHWPYIPPPAYKEKFLHDFRYKQDSQELVINKDYNNSIGGIGEARLLGFNGEFVTDKAYYVSRYDSEIFFMDEQIGRIIEYLKQKEDYENWIILLLSDHGENLGEDNYFFDHGYSISEGSARIPLIIKLPGQTKGVTVNDPVSICDIYPTIAGLLKLHISKQKNGLYGTDIVNRNYLTRYLNNKFRIIMLENAPLHQAERNKIIGCIWKSYKLIFNLTTNKKILYDISKGEIRLKNDIGQGKRILKKLSGILTRLFVKKNALSLVNIEKLKAIEELKSLGYLQ